MTPDYHQIMARLYARAAEQCIRAPEHPMTPDYHQIMARLYARAAEQCIRRNQLERAQHYMSLAAEYACGGRRASR